MIIDEIDKIATEAEESVEVIEEDHEGLKAFHIETEEY